MDVNIFIAFFSGLVSFFAPCVIPLFPAYVSYITGISVQELKNQSQPKWFRSKIFWSSVCYILGFSLIFVLLGTAAGGIGLAIRHHTVWIQRVGGLLIVAFGLHLLGILPLPWFDQSNKVTVPKWLDGLGYARAFVIGIIFATTWIPCIGAVLGAILTMAAISATALSGAILLFFYSLGISVPFLLLAVTIAHSGKFLKGINKYLPLLTKISGAILVIVGLLLFNNTLKLISPTLTFDNLNGWLYVQAYKLGYRMY